MNAGRQPLINRRRWPIKSFVVCLGVLALAWCLWQFWPLVVDSPRAKVADVERSIKEALAKGSPRSDVMQWILGQQLIDHRDDKYANYKGQKGIEAVILNNTPGVDLRILFFFDANGCLEEFKVRNEGRFSTRDDD